MKITGKIRHLSAILLTALAAASFSPAVSAAQTVRVSGLVEEIRDNEVKMYFFWLNAWDGRKIFLDATYEAEENPDKACVGAASDSETEVTLEGVLEEQGGVISFKDNAYRCVFPAS